MALDGLGNLYLADTNASIVKTGTLAYLSLGAASRTEESQSGTDSVTYQVLPASTPLTAASRQKWLTITSLANGVLSFSFSANTSVNSRAATIAVWGQQVTVTQNADIAANITRTAGRGQRTGEGQVFATALKVKVTDAAGNPVQGAPVTFTVVPGSSGASGSFSSSPPMPIVTNVSGVAIAPTLTANNTPGTFTVSATVGGLA